MVKRIEKTIEHHASGETITILFTPGNHQYRIDGKILPSVTTIIGQLDKPALLHWAAKLSATYVLETCINQKTGKLKKKIPPASLIFQEAKQQHSRELSKAGEIGTAVHASIEKYLRMGKKPRLKKDSLMFRTMHSFYDWQKSIDFGIPIALEMMLVNTDPNWSYVGTVDCVAMLGDKRYVVDFKTSNDFHEPDMPMQLAAYAAAYEGQTGHAVDGIGILRIDKETGEFFWRDYSSVYEEAIEAFLRLASFRAAKDVLMKGVRTIKKDQGLGSEEKSARLRVQKEKVS